MMLISTINKQTVRSEPIVAMAYDANLLDAQLLCDRRLAHQIIITESVIFME